LCPVDNGQRSATGCVATAMAQILKYHNWPDCGVGSHSYVCKTLKQELSFDFGATTFEWDHMQNTYTSSNSSNFTNNRAVATLLYACGVASDMDYSAGGSGAIVKTALNGMINYLKIDKGASIQQRSWYNITEWEDLMYENLANCGPIMYYGAADRYNAHEFVCDGYSNDGYFHINWGWGGMSDGYFLLTALDPALQGIGGSSGGYNLWQTAVIGIRPANETSEYAQLISSGSNLRGEGGNKSVTVKGSFYNESLVALNDVVLGVKIDNRFYPGLSMSEPLSSGHGVGQFSVRLTDLSEGTYHVYPAFKTSIADWQLMKCSYNNANYFDITVGADGNITVKNISTSINLGLKNLICNTPFSPGKRFNVTATITNNGSTEFYDDILLIMNGGDIPLTLSRVRVDLLPGTSEDLKIEAFSPDDGTPGSYSLMCARISDSKNIAIGTPTGISVKASQPADLNIKSASIRNATAVDPENITFDLVVNNPGGYYYGPLTAYLFPDGAPSLDYIDSPSFMIEEGAEDMHLTFTGSFPDALPLKRYVVNFYYYTFGGDKIIYHAYPSFTTRGESGIGEINSDSDVIAIEICTLPGVRIPPPADVTAIDS
ncbi:MAG: C10 family peptidase, partial [Duncaniella sp.]|nr:C10 family peptidase [Duncaniella sp.]